MAVYGASDTAYVTANGTAEHEQLFATTRSKPKRIMLDPFVESHDWNMLNNQYRFGALGGLFASHKPPTERYLDTYFSPRVSRDHLTVGIMPTLWYNDVAGATIGLHSRQDYLGRFEQNDFSAFCGVRDTVTGGGSMGSCGFSVTLGNPTWWRSPNTSQQLTAFRFEGRAGAGLRVERVRQEHLGFGPTHTAGFSVNWLATYDMAYLPPTLWDDGGSVEAAAWLGVSDHRGSWNLALTVRGAGGVMYRSPGGGFTTTERYDAQAYVRPEITATATRAIGKRSTFGVRAYAAGVFSDDPVLSQRRIFIAGADPTASLNNPFLRSVGAPLIREDCWCRWQMPGDGNLRGFQQSFSTDRLVAVNAELESTLFKEKVVPGVALRSKLATRVALALFADGGYTGASSGIGGTGDATFLPTPARALADAGLGLRITHRIGATTWTSRADFPIFVSDAQWAFAHRAWQYRIRSPDHFVLAGDQVKTPSGDRRSFFKTAFGGALDHIARATEERIVQKRYVRPPGALPEMGFLAACTRCGQCAPVCPPSAIKFVGPDGGLAAGTPYLEVEQVPCIACPDMPCATACPTDALIVPQRGWTGTRLGRITFHPDRCITFQGQACAICVQACPIGTKALELDADGRPVLKLEGCVACGVCVRECPTMPSSLTFAPLER